MLNHIWLTMLIVGILVAVGNDVSDEITNPYRNGVPLDVLFEQARQADREGEVWEAVIVLEGSSYSGFYGVEPATAQIRQPVRIRRGAAVATFSLRPSDGRRECGRRWRASGAKKVSFLER